MRFFADKGLDFPVVALLRKKGFTVIMLLKNLSRRQMRGYYELRLNVLYFNNEG